MGIGKNIKTILDRQGRSIAWLSKQIGVNVNTLYGYINRDSNKLDEKIIINTAFCLGLPVNEITKGTKLLSFYNEKLISFFENSCSNYTLKNELDEDGFEVYVITDKTTGESHYFSLGEILMLKRIIINNADEIIKARFNPLEMTGEEYDRLFQIEKNNQSAYYIK